MISENLSRCTFLCSACLHRKSEQSTHKNSAPEFLVLSILNELSSCGLVGFIDSRNFKTFLIENYVITLINCYMFTKKLMNMGLNMVLVVP